MKTRRGDKVGEIGDNRVPRNPKICDQMCFIKHMRSYKGGRVHKCSYGMKRITLRSPKMRESHHVLVWSVKAKEE